MALSLITPVASSVILAGDGISFSVADTYSSLIITITAVAGDEVAYNSATGAGAGYSVTVANAASVDTFTVTRDVGWDLEPQVINVAVVDGGAYAEEWSYYLGTQRRYPQNSEPLNPVYVGTLIITEDNVQVRDDVGWIEFDPATFNVADSGSGKVTVTGVGGGGSGDVVGPASAVDDNVAVYDSTTGKLIKDGGQTIAQILAGATDADAIHDNVAAEFSPLTGKSNPVDADLLLLEDSADSFNKKKLTLSNLLATLTTQQGFGIWQYTGDADTTPASGGFSFDTSGIGIADHIYVHENNASGMDMALVLGSLKVDDIIYIGHSSLKTVGSMHKLTGTPTLTANVWDIPIDGATSGATSSPDWTLNDFAYFVVLTADTTGVATRDTRGIGVWTMDSVVGGTPSSGGASVSTTGAGSITSIKLHDQSDGNDYGTPLGELQDNDWVVIRDINASGAYGAYRVASVSAAANVTTITVDAQTGTSGVFGISDEIEVYLIKGPTVDDTEATVTLVGDTSTQQELNKLADGCSLDTPSLTATSSGSAWTATLEKSGTGDIRYRFNGQTYTLDCTPATTVGLTAGTATVPQINYVYVVESGGTLTLTANTTGFPTTAARVATVYCQDAAAGATDGALKLHQWNDHVASDIGHVSHINEKLRRGDADWASGCSATMIIAAPDASFNVATGKVFQVHEQTFPAIVGATSGMWVVNYHNGTIPVPFTKITSLDTVDWDSAGVSINNRYFPLVVWGTQNANGTGKIFINLPSGSYSTSVAAQADADNYANYNIPPEFKGTGFLIARFNVQGKTSGTWVEVDSVDLRGLTPAGSPSASSGSGDVVGPGASVLSDAIASYDGTGGLTIKESNVLVGAGSVGTGTRTLGANSTLSGGFLASAGSSIVSSGNGSIALGYATGAASVNATGIGSIALGYCSQSISGTAANITNSGLGSLVIGATAQTVSGTASLNCSTAGAFVGGYASQGGLVEAVSASNGCCATGYADGTGSIIRVTGALGGFASGSAQGGGTIITSGKGAFASGAADIQSGGTAGTIAASGLGSFAGGSALGAVAGGTAQITASGSGSFAWGSVLAVAVTSAIAATATNAVQFGIGTNAVADSLQVGDTTNGLRLLAKGTTSTTVGSFWTDGTDVFCRTGGVTKNLTNI